MDSLLHIKGPSCGSDRTAAHSRNTQRTDGFNTTANSVVFMTCRAQVDVLLNRENKENKEKIEKIEKIEM